MISMIGAFLGLPAALLTLIAGSLLGAMGGLIYIHSSGKDCVDLRASIRQFSGRAAALAIAIYGEFLARMHPR